MSVPPVAAKPPPARGWFVVAALVVVAAIVVSSLFVIYRVNGLGARLQQVIVPGEASLTLTTGSYTIFHEYNSVVDGKVYSAPALSGLRISVAAPGGKTLALNPPGGTSRYSFASREGISVFNFEVAEPGTYRLTASYANGRSEPQTVLSIGSGFVAGIITTVMIALLVAFAGIGVGVAVAVVVYQARRRASAPIP